MSPVVRSSSVPGLLYRERLLAISCVPFLLVVSTRLQVLLLLPRFMAFRLQAVRVLLLPVEVGMGVGCVGWFLRDF